LGSTRTARSPEKPPTPDVVELRPPPEFGFSGTAKFDINDPASMGIAAELRKRGYTIVVDDEAPDRR
jgi:hypothetical protein